MHEMKEIEKIALLEFVIKRKTLSEGDKKVGSIDQADVPFSSSS